MIGVYGIYNVVRDKWYVGSSLNISQRWSNHKSTLQRGCHHNIKLQNAYNVYGESAFEYHVLTPCTTPDVLEKYEVLWAVALDAFGDGYTLKLGGRQERRMSDESRKKMSEAKKGRSNTWWIGRSHTPEAKRKISERAKQRTPETRKKMSEAQLGKVKMAPEEYKRIGRLNKGRKRTDEQKQRISEGIRRAKELGVGRYRKTTVPEVHHKNT